MACWCSGRDDVGSPWQHLQLAGFVSTTHLDTVSIYTEYTQQNHLITSCAEFHQTFVKYEHLYVPHTRLSIYFASYSLKTFEHVCQT